MGVEPSVGVVAKRDEPPAQQLATTIVAALADDGVAVVVDELTAGAVEDSVEGVPVGAMHDRDLVVSIGGDGTFLFVVREVGSVPIVGVNLGEVGFLNPVVPDEAVETVHTLVERLREEGDLACRSVPRIRASDVGDDWRLAPALNEVVVQGPRRGPAGGLDLEVSVDGRRFAAGGADGVVVATAAGSTAYNLSDGGPIVAPGVDALVVTLQCATDPMPSLVVDSGSEVTVRVAEPEEAFAVADGRVTQPLEPPATVRIRESDEPACLVGPTVDFFDALGKLE